MQQSYWKDFYMHNIKILTTKLQESIILETKMDGPLRKAKQMDYKKELNSNTNSYPSHDNVLYIELDKIRIVSQQLLIQVQKRLDLLKMTF